MTDNSRGGSAASGRGADHKPWKNPQHRDNSVHRPSILNQNADARQSAAAPPSRPVDLLTRRGIETARNARRKGAILSSAQVNYVA